MTIQKVIHGDFLNIRTGVLLFGLNPNGDLDKGLSISIKSKFPEFYEEFKQKQVSGLVSGDVVLYRVDDNKWIAGAALNNNFGEMAVDITDALEQALDKLAPFAANLELPIMFPRIAGPSDEEWCKIALLIDRKCNTYGANAFLVEMPPITTTSGHMKGIKDGIPIDYSTNIDLDLDN